MRVALMGMGRLGQTMHQALLRAPQSMGVVPLPWRRGEPMPAPGTVDVYWICVSDAAVAEVAAQIQPGGATPVLHASGALSHDVLRPHRPAGSLHPLQSFPGPDVATPPLEGVAAAVAGDLEAVLVARRLAEALGMAPFTVSGDRRAYHAAAVIAGNFGTTLVAEASRLLVMAGVPVQDAPRILGPLALASIAQATTGPAPDPAAALTGPFPRGDASTIASHLSVLDESDPTLAALYRVMGSASVQLLAADGRLSPAKREELSATLDHR